MISNSGIQMIKTFTMVQYFEGKHLYSDHALVELELNLDEIDISRHLLYVRANNLGKSCYENEPVRIERSLRLSQCNADNVRHFFENNPPPIIDDFDSVDAVVNEFDRIVVDVLKKNEDVKPTVTNEWGNEEKWKRLLEHNDYRTIWKAINWDGGIDETVVDVPSDEEFRLHFESLLNPQSTEDEDVDVSDLPYIPVLDDPITEVEVIEAAETCKESKSYIGITPAIFKCLPAAWISFITHIINLIFLSEQMCYPIKWCYNKLIVLFKKGIRLVCGNYRGLSIGDTMGKIYGKILSNRLKLWMNIEKCQAGSQENRCCEEHILALRLMINYAKNKKEKLFIIFVDFSKAYDRVPRNTLFDILKKSGCGKVFLRALKAIYKDTINILNSEFIRSTIGVKQGGPMSCLLFVIYLNVLALLLKLFGNDSFLGNVHALMLMDDTVLMASSRELIIEKFGTLMVFCRNYGMLVNKVKTKLMVINGCKKDRENIIVDNVIVEHTTSYIYLGSPFTENASMGSVLELHAKIKTSDINKFKIFCAKNVTMPFKYKKMVFDSCIISSLLYGCESWLTSNVKDIERLYHSAVKSLLGVRDTTRNDIILIECGLTKIDELIKKRTARFMKKQFLGVPDHDKPLVQIYRICELNRSDGYRFIDNLLNVNVVQFPTILETFANEEGTKAVTYRLMNPELKVHDVYVTDEYLNEKNRIVFTRLRLSSHNLNIEKGRWSRTIRENRVCDCGPIVQDEAHVLFDCPKTATARDRYNVNSDMFPDIGTLMKALNPRDIVSFIKRCLDEFD